MYREYPAWQWIIGGILVAPALLMLVGTVFPKTRRILYPGVIWVLSAVILAALIGALSSIGSEESATMLATSQPARVNTPVPQPAFSVIELSGTGEDTRNVELPDGLYTVASSVNATGHSNFSVWIESVDGGRELLANELVSTGWSGKTTTRIGGSFARIAAGKQIISVNANGPWRITIEKQ